MEKQAANAAVGNSLKRTPSDDDVNRRRTAKKHQTSNTPRIDANKLPAEASAGLPTSQYETSILANNTFSTLKDGETGVPPVTNKQKKRIAAVPSMADPERKEKCPPIYIQGDPPGLRQTLRERIAKGTLKCSLRLCSDGLKVLADSKPQFYRVLDILKMGKHEYFTHDIPGDKPLKVVLRGLEDMDIKNVEKELENCGLKVTNLYKIARRDTTRKYRDQLYLVHIERNSITLKELKTIRIINYTQVEWQRYRPVHREVTQCMNCCGFGHGTRNCFMAPRCAKCGGDDHNIEGCMRVAFEKEFPDTKMESKCSNCGGPHQASSKDCLKRKEFIEIRKKARTKNQPRSHPPALDILNFPELTSGPAASRSNPKPKSSNNPWLPPPPPPGFRRQQQEGESLPEEGSPLYTMEQLVPIFHQLADRLRCCKTRYEQICALGLFILENGN